MSFNAAGDALTLIITTSPVPSAPSTELLDAVFKSFSEHCPVLHKCSIILVFDTYERITEQARLKKGCVTADGARAFAQYKQNVKQLILARYSHAVDASLETSEQEAEFGSPCKEENSVTLEVSSTKDNRVTFVEPRLRLGFSLAVRSALRLVTTPYVWVHQHDWTLQTPISIRSMLSIMEEHKGSTLAPVKYICLPSVRLFKYAEQSENRQYPSFRKLTEQLRQEFETSSDTGHPEVVPLSPLFFWHDKPHLASTEHYLQRVFPSRLATKRGTYIEDTIGQKARAQMKNDPEQWKKWATWLYYPNDGQQLCLRHLQGRTRHDMVTQTENIRRWKVVGHNDTIDVRFAGTEDNYGDDLVKL